MYYNGYTKVCINYNGAALCRVNSPVRAFSGSSSFIFQDGELFRRSENKSALHFEEHSQPIIEQNLIPFSFEPSPVKKRTYTVNKKIISRKINAFFHSKLANKRFNFYTISFPLSTSDDSAFKLFNAVLTRLRKGYILSSIAAVILEKYSVNKSAKWLFSIKQLLRSNNFQQLNNYLWVAERQANGTIHFHIITSDIINVLVFNHFVAAYIFNSLQKNDKSINISHLTQSQYNGVDVSKRKTGISSVTDVRKYITKYVTKNKEKFTHYAWHCSRSISALFTTCEFPVSSMLDDNFPIDVNYKSEYYYESKYYTFIFYPNINYESVFKDLIAINNDIIDCFFSQ